MSKNYQLKTPKRGKTGAGAKNSTVKAIKKAVKKARKLPVAALVIIIIVVIAAVIALYFTGGLQTVLHFILDGYDSDNSGNNGELTSAHGDLRIHINDVGQGDNILIEFPDGKNMVIDGGDRFNTVRDDVLAYLATRNIATLDYVILTHTDADHCGSLDDIINAADNVNTVYLPKIKTSDTHQNSDLGLSDSGVHAVTTAVYRDFVAAALAATYSEDGTQNRAKLEFLIDEIVIEGGSYRFTMYCVTAAYYENMSGNSRELNDVSPICVLEYAGRKAVFTGDANYSTISSSAEKRFLDKMAEKGYSHYDCDILKVAHHGAATSSGMDFLSFISAEYAIISVGTDSGNNSSGSYSGFVSDAYYRAGYTLDTCGNGKYDHPHRSVAGVPTNGEGRLAASGVLELYRTDLNGDTVVTISDEGAISVTATKTASVQDDTVVYIAVTFESAERDIMLINLYYEERLRAF